MTPCLAFAVAPDHVAVSESVARIGQFSSDAGRDHLAMACELVAAEALANIVRHNRPGGDISVRVRTLGPGMVLTVRDCGYGFDMATAHAALPDDNRAEGGRGLWLIQSLARSRYRRHHGCNVHRFCITHAIGAS